MFKCQIVKKHRKLPHTFSKKQVYPSSWGWLTAHTSDWKNPVRKKIPPPERFFNRKSYYSLNCMMVCDFKRRIRHFTCRHVGSAHDSRIFNESFLKADLERNFDKKNPRVLIGDEGYPCTNILLTPIRSDRVSTREEIEVSYSHFQSQKGIMVMNIDAA